MTSLNHGICDNYYTQINLVYTHKLMVFIKNTSVFLCKSIINNYTYLSKIYRNRFANILFFLNELYTQILNEENKKLLFNPENLFYLFFLMTIVYTIKSIIYFNMICDQNEKDIKPKKRKRTHKENLNKKYSIRKGYNIIDTDEEYINKNSKVFIVEKRRCQYCNFIKQNSDFDDINGFNFTCILCNKNRVDAIYHVIDSMVKIINSDDRASKKIVLLQSDILKLKNISENKM